MVLAINDNSNVYIKTREGNMDHAITAPDGTGDLAVDREIAAALDAVASGSASVVLPAYVANRARRSVAKALAGDLPVEYKETVRALFTRMRDEKGHKIV
jgi:hypothetical protein